MKKHYESYRDFYFAICDAKTTKKMQKVIDSCENIDVTGNKYGFTALMCAVYSANRQVAKLLLENGANPEVKDIDGQSVLVLAPQGEIKAMVLRAIVTKYWQEKRSARINKSRGLAR